MAIFLKKKKIFGNFFEKMSSFWQFFDSQMAIFPECQVRSTYLVVEAVTKVPHVWMTVAQVVLFVSDCFRTK